MHGLAGGWGDGVDHFRGNARSCQGLEPTAVAAMLRPLSVRSGTISAEGKVVKLGRRTSYAEGFVRDGSGNLAVHATATFSMIGEAPQPK